MTRACFLTLGGVVALAGLARGEDLDEIKKEADALRKYERAIGFAEASLQQARELSKAGESAKAPEALNRMAEASELSLQALRDTGRKPGKLTKQYKQGEIKTRDMLRKLESLIAALDFSDRAKAESAQMRLTATHEEYLLGIMSK